MDYRTMTYCDICHTYRENHIKKCPTCAANNRAFKATDRKVMLVFLAIIIVPLLFGCRAPLEIVGAIVVMALFGWIFGD